MCPGWDKALVEAVKSKLDNAFYLSGTLIEPIGNNPVVQVQNFGQTIADFKEEKLLDSLKKLSKDDWSGASWPPSLMHREMWDKIGGFSEEYFPGMYSDPDISMKLWQEGVRDFHGIGDCLIYHFRSQSTGRVIKNNGSKTFLNKWGLTARVFYKYYLKMGSKYTGPLDEARVPHLEWIKNRLKYYVT